MTQQRFYAAVLAGVLVCPPPALALRNLSPADNAGLEDELRRSLQAGAKPEPQRSGTEGVWKWDFSPYGQVVAAAFPLKRQWLSWLAGFRPWRSMRQEVSLPDGGDPIPFAWVGRGTFLQIPWDILLEAGKRGLSLTRNSGAVDSYIQLEVRPGIDAKGLPRLMSRWVRRIEPGGQAVHTTLREVGVDPPGPVWTGVGEGFSASKTAAGVKVQLNRNPPNYYVEIRELEPAGSILARLDGTADSREAKDLLLMDLALRKALQGEEAAAALSKLLSALSDGAWFIAHPQLSTLLAQALPRFEGLSKTQLNAAIAVLETRVGQTEGETGEQIRNAMEALREKLDGAPGTAAGTEEPGLEKVTASWDGVATTPAKVVEKRLLPLFYDIGTFHVLPLIVRSKIAFVVVVAPDEEEMVRDLLNAVRAPETQYRLVVSQGKAEGIVKAQTEYAGNYRVHLVNKARRNWLGELLAGLEADGIIPVGEWEPALQTTERYFQQLA